MQNKKNKKWNWETFLIVSNFLLLKFYTLPKPYISTEYMDDKPLLLRLIQIEDYYILLLFTSGFNNKRIGFTKFQHNMKIGTPSSI